jgi:transglutaminase-like putative cysteine protease
MTPSLRELLAEHLKLDAPNMEVTEEFVNLAKEICGDETNIAIQARKILEHVAATVDHYSYSEDPNMPHCGIGNSKICKKQGGGCCTDLNSYFISLVRARGIASRLKMGYRLQDKNRGKQVDPGYRCWIEYFVPGYGWVSADVVEADTPGGMGHERWMLGLTSRRLFLNEGREFRFGDDAKAKTVNHMSIAYAEIDGEPARLLPEGELKPQITRTVVYTEEPATDR